MNSIKNDALDDTLLTYPEVVKYWNEKFEGTPFTVTVEQIIEVSGTRFEVSAHIKIFDMNKFSWQKFFVRTSAIERENKKWRLEFQYKMMMEAYAKTTSEAMGYQQHIQALLRILKTDQVKRDVLEDVLLKALGQLNEERHQKLLDEILEMKFYESG